MSTKEENEAIQALKQITKRFKTYRITKQIRVSDKVHRALKIKSKETKKSISKLADQILHKGITNSKLF